MTHSVNYPSEGILELDELYPERWHIPQGTWSIHFTNIEQRPVDKDRVIAVLLREPVRNEVRVVEIAWNSQMESTWVAEYFPNLVGIGLNGMRLATLDELVNVPNLVHLDVHTRQMSKRSLHVLPKLRLKRLELTITEINDIRHLNACLPLERCTLRKWPKADFSSIPDLLIDDLTVIGGIAAGPCGVNCRNLKHAGFASCTRLVSLNGLSVPSLVLERCRKVDLDQLRAVHSLRKLHLIEHSHIHSFDFVLRCPELEELIISGSKILARNISPLIESISLRKVEMYTVPDKVILDAGRANKQLTIKNENICLSSGESC